MLKYIEIFSASEGAEFFLSKKSAKWIVSDLVTENYYQKLNYDKTPNNYMDVLRIRSFLKNYFFQIYVDFEILDPSVFNAWIESNYKNDVKKLEITNQSFQAYFDQLIPILCHSQGELLLNDWFQEKKSEDSEINWQKIFLVSKQIFDDMKMAKLTLEKCIPFLLCDINILENFEGSDLIFNLGFNITSIEVELIKNLSRFYEVIVVVPTISEKKLNDQFFLKSSINDSYEIIKSNGNKIILQKEEEVSKEYNATETVKSIKIIPEKVVQKKLLTQTVTNEFEITLDEVKFTISSIRQLIESGADASSICIAAPNIEKIWPSLKIISKVENIFLNKNQSTKVHNFSEISSWISILKMTINIVSKSSADHLFRIGSDDSLNYEKYSSYLKNIDNMDDINQNSLLTMKLKKINFNVINKISKKEFIELALDFADNFSALGREQIVKVCQKIYEICPKNLKFQVEVWIGLTERIALTLDLNFANESQGVQCINLSETTFLNFQYLFVLNLNEAEVKNISTNLLASEDVFFLNQSFGFQLEDPDKNLNKKSLFWLLQSDFTKSYFLYSKMCSQGKMHHPSHFFYKIYQTSENIEDFESFHSKKLYYNFWTSGRVDVNAAGSKADLISKINNDNEFIIPKNIEEYSLSASSLKNLKLCPFKFGAKKNLKLRDSAALDVDIDPLTKGRFIHKTLELLVSKSQESVSEEELKIIVNKFNYKIGEPIQWKYLFPQYVRLINKLLQNDKCKKSYFSGYKNIANELKFSGYLCAKTGEFLSENGNDRVKFTGVIDRVDKNVDDQYILTDYKFSEFPVKKVNTWVSDDEVQLLIYHLAFENGLCAGVRGSVVSSGYYFVKQIERQVGLFLDVESLKPYRKQIKGKFLLSIDEFTKIKDEFNTSLKETLAFIKSGDFTPNPKDLTLCSNCDWRKVCRK